MKPASPAVLEREIEGARLLLHPERALSWPDRRLLVVADTHFGKSSLFARHGIAVPGGADSHDLDRLTTLLESTRSERLLILGDFLHGDVLPGSEVALHLERWIGNLQSVQLLLVIGNHDRSAASGWRATSHWVGDFLDEGPFRFTHEAAPGGGAAGKFFVSGHIHPVIALGGLRKRRPRIPVFWERPGALVLPSFGLFTGGYRISPAQGDRVYAAGPESVVELG
jgi:uncharacterized protein